MMEDPQKWKTSKMTLKTRTPGQPGPPGSVCPIIVQQPQVTLDTIALENTFGTVGQSMLQLARAQAKQIAFTTTSATRTNEYASTYQNSSTISNIYIPMKF